MNANARRGARRAGLVGLLAGATILTPVLAAPTVTAALAQAGFWSPHQEIDDLDNLPRRYSCDALYYKYRDVLLLVGARPGMTIYAYGCSGPHGNTSVPAHVDLSYQVPTAYPPGIDGPGVALRVRPTTVTLGPGHPKSIDASDCALLEDMAQTVLTSFDAHINAEDMHCGASSRTARRFDVAVRTMIPVSTVAQLGPRVGDASPAS